MAHGMLKDIHGQLLPPKNVPFLHALSSYFRDPELVTWAHLWFLAYLWTFTVLYAPVWALLSSRIANLITDKPVRIKAVLFLSFCAVTASEVSLRKRWPGYQNLIDDWANFASYSMFLLLGLLIGSVSSVRHEVRQCAIFLLTAGLAASTWHAAYCRKVSTIFVWLEGLYLRLG